MDRSCIYRCLINKLCIKNKQKKNTDLLVFQRTAQTPNSVFKKAILRSSMTFGGISCIQRQIAPSPALYRAGKEKHFQEQEKKSHSLSSNWLNGLLRSLSFWHRPQLQLCWTYHALSPLTSPGSPDRHHQPLVDTGWVWRRHQDHQHFNTKLITLDHGLLTQDYTPWKHGWREFLGFPLAQRNSEAQASESIWHFVFSIRLPMAEGHTGGILFILPIWLPATWYSLVKLIVSPTSICTIFWDAKLNSAVLLVLG